MGGVLIRSVPTLMQPEKAERIAAELQADPEDGWSYEAEHDPRGTGLSRVRIRDNVGEEVGFL